MPFTASIIERVFAYVPDKIIRLGGASWLRPLGGPTLASPWERIRIGILCAVTPNGVDNISDVLFLLGLTATQSAPGAAYSTDNFIGFSVVGSPALGSTRLLTYNAGAGNPYFSCTGGVAFHKSNNSLLSTSAASTAMLLPLSRTGFYFRRGIIIVDITKSTGGSGSTTINVFCNNTAASVQTTDFRPNDLLAALDQPGTPNVRSIAFTQVLTTTAVNYSPIGGEVNTLEIFWSSVAFPLEISAIGAVVFRPMTYFDTGVADDTFEAYDVSGGSVTTEISAGSGWNAAASITAFNTSNFAPQVFLQFVGTTNSPDETFEQYGTGSIYSGDINAGTYWAGSLFVTSATANVYPQEFTALAGTNLGAYDNFDSYPLGAVVSGITITAGSAWAAAGSIY